VPREQPLCAEGEVEGQAGIFDADADLFSVQGLPGLVVQPVAQRQVDGARKNQRVGVARQQRDQVADRLRNQEGLHAITSL
jgi:hypothetical protein